MYNNALITSQTNDNYEHIITNPKLLGGLVESSIGAHLTNYSISERYNLYYWREGQYEVDFILEKGSEIIGLEVKSGKRAENKGMQVFADKFHPSKVLQIGTGGIPYEEFLKINPKELFL